MRSECFAYRASKFRVRETHSCFGRWPWCDPSSVSRARNSLMLRSLALVRSIFSFACAKLTHASVVGLGAIHLQFRVRETHSCFGHWPWCDLSSVSRARNLSTLIGFENRSSLMNRFDVLPAQLTGAHLS